MLFPRRGVPVTIVTPVLLWEFVRVMGRRADQSRVMRSGIAAAIRASSGDLGGINSLSRQYAQIVLVMRKGP